MFSQNNLLQKMDLEEKKEDNKRKREMGASELPAAKYQKTNTTSSLYQTSNTPEETDPSLDIVSDIIFSLNKCHFRR